MDRLCAGVLMGEDDCSDDRHSDGATELADRLDDPRRLRSLGCESDDDPLLAVGTVRGEAAQGGGNEEDNDTGAERGDRAAFDPEFAAERQLRPLRRRRR